MELAEGELRIVATPIGNLKDITLRALEVLKTSDLILSEDTRETEKVLEHYGIKAHQISYRDQNHEKIFLSVLNDLISGKKVSLVSDNGTPTISDPGFKLVRDLRKNGFNAITPIPGPSAFVAALCASGLPTDKFCFLGFLPKKLNEQLKELEKQKNFDGTLIIYESPLRLAQTLKMAQDILGDRYSCVCNEVTKIKEKFISGNLSELYSNFSSNQVKGEIILLISKEGFSNDSR